MERVDEIETAQPFVAQHHETGIRARQILQRLRAQEQGSGRHPVVCTGERGAEMMACQQPGPGFATHRLAEHRNPSLQRRSPSPPVP
jgi:hypothetical protein